MMFWNKVRILLLVLLGLCCAGSLWAAAFTVNFSDIDVDNIQPGVPVSLLQKASFMLSVNNVDTLSSNISLEVISPLKNQLKEGYEPIPDVNWIKFDRASSWIKPNQTENFDLIIYAPYDQKLFGRKYQAILVVYTLEGVLKVNLKSKIFISFTGDRYPVEAVDQKIKEVQPASKILMAEPKLSSVLKVNPKKKLDYSKLVITNNSPDKVTLDLYAVGLVNVPDAPGLLSFKNPRIELNSKESKTVSLNINFPLLRLKKSEPMLLLIGAKDTKNPPVLGQFGLLKLQFD
jgi:hypothetical protein